MGLRTANRALSDKPNTKSRRLPPVRSPNAPVETTFWLVTLRSKTSSWSAAGCGPRV